jgi:integrase/recombinase XerC
MFDEVAPPRDVSQLRLPLIGRVDRDVSGAWQVFGPDGQPSSAARLFLSDLSASDCAVSTIRSYAYDLLRWFRFLSAVDVEWRQATRREVRDFVRWFRGAPNPQRDRGTGPGRPAAGTLNPHSGKAYLSNGYAPRTINHALSVVSAFYAFAVAAGLGPLQNPVPAAQRHATSTVPSSGAHRRAALRQKEPRRQPRDVPDELLEQMIGELACDRDRALVSVALGSGLRAGELLSMTCGGIDAGRGVLRVVPKGGVVPIWVPATPDAFVEVSRYLLSRVPVVGSDPLWITRRAPARPLTYFALRQILERINARLGTNISWHDLRHTFTHRLLSDDAVGISDVQQLLRHRDLTTLSSYSTTRVEALARRLHDYEARPHPPATPAVEYDPTELRALFPGLQLSPPKATEQ